MSEKEKRMESEDYRFMKETIKPRPFDRRKFAKKVMGIIAGGVLLGACAIFVISVLYPDAAKELELDTLTDDSQEDVIKYLGISGTTISEKQAKKKDIPNGIYVDEVAYDSPAMNAGVQKGDIIHALNEEETLTMPAYTEKLQSLDAGEEVLLSLYRQDAGGQYVDMNMELTIEEK